MVPSCSHHHLRLLEVVVACLDKMAAGQADAAVAAAGPGRSLRMDHICLPWPSVDNVRGEA